MTGLTARRMAPTARPAPTNADRDAANRKVPIHGPEDFIGMRAAGRLAGLTLDHVTPFVRPGVSTGVPRLPRSARLPAAG